MAFRARGAVFVVASGIVLTGCPGEQADDPGSEARFDGGIDAPQMQVLDASDDGDAGDAEVEPTCDRKDLLYTSTGCDFRVSTPAFDRSARPPCFAVYLTNGSRTKPARVTVGLGDTQFDVTQIARLAEPSNADPQKAPYPDSAAWSPVTEEGIPPGKTAILFLSDDPGSMHDGAPLTCPIPPAVRAPGGTAIWSETGVKSGFGRAFHITTDVPVTAHDMMGYGGAKSYLPSAGLLLPTTAWGNAFMVALPPKGTDGAPYVQVIAAEDKTEVTILPSVPLPGDGATLPAAPKGVPTTVVLNAGELLQWQANSDMSGSVIQANRSVALIGGQTRMCIGSKTATGGPCGGAHQTITPVMALGREYVAAPFVSRRDENPGPHAGAPPESIPYRLVGLTDGTELAYDPPVDGAPTSLGLGQIADFEATGPFAVRSSDEAHPFYAGQMMPGYAPSASRRFGATWVNLVPTDQYLRRYSFYADLAFGPGVGAGTSRLALVREKRPDGLFEEVSLDTCCGQVTGWQPFGTGQYEIAYVTMVVGGNVVSSPGGPQVAHSNDVFGLTVWGTDTDVAYAYPAGSDAHNHTMHGLPK